MPTKDIATLQATPIEDLKATAATPGTVTLDVLIAGIDRARFGFFTADALSLRPGALVCEVNVPSLNSGHSVMKSLLVADVLGDDATATLTESLIRLFEYVRGNADVTL